MTNQSNYGSVTIRRVSAKYGNVYAPRYFGDRHKEPRHAKSRERTVVTFTNSDAIMFSKNIAMICAQASRTSRREPRITESKLVSKISKLLFD